MNIPVQEIMTEWEMVDGVFECNHIEVLVEKAEDQDGTAWPR